MRTNTGGTTLDFFDLLNAKTFKAFGEGQNKEGYLSFKHAMRRELKEIYELRPDVEFLKSRDYWVTARCYDTIMRGKKSDKDDKTSNWAGNPVSQSLTLKAASGDLFQDEFRENLENFHEAKQYFMNKNLATQHERMPFPMMTIPAYFFLREFNYKEENILPQQRDFFWWWYWSSVFGERYSFTSNEAAAMDIPALQKVARNDKDALPEKYISSHQRKGYVGTDSDTGLTVIKKAEGSGHFTRSIRVLGLFIGDGVTGTPPRKGLDLFAGDDLQDLPARSWEKGKKKGKKRLQKRVEIHHIFPKAYLKKTSYSGVYMNSVCNLMFASKTANREITESPGEYLAPGFKGVNIDANAIKTHFVSDEMFTKLQSGDYDEDFDQFIEDRAKVIKAAIIEQVRNKGRPQGL